MSVTPVNWIRRFYFHLYRYRTFLIIIVSFLTIGVAVNGSMYPGEENLETYVSYLSVLGTLTLDNPGYHFWLLLMVNMSLTIFLPILAVFLGTNILPFKEKEGKEYLFSTPKSTVKFYFENSILASFLLILGILPAYIIAIIHAYLNQTLESVRNLTIGFVLALILAGFILFLTAFGSSLNFSKAAGIKIGGGYFIFSFLIDQTRAIPEFDILRQISLYSQAEITVHSFLGTWNEQFIAITLVLIFFLIFLTVFILDRKDFLEGGIYTFTEVKEKEQISTSTRDRILVVKKPLDALISRLGWKNPAFRDQLHSNSGLFVIFLVFIMTISSYMVLIYVQSGETGIASVLASLDQPMINSAMFNYRYDPSMNNLAYLITIEVLAFGWMSFGPFLLYLVYDISTRDYKNGYSETTWILPQTAEKIYFTRTLSGLFYIILLFLGSLASILGAEVFFGVYTDIEPTILGYVAATWAYCIIFIFFVSLTLVFHQKNALMTITISFFIAIMILLIGFTLNFQSLIYLSPFGYFDFIGVFLGQITFFDFLPPALIGSVICLVLFWFTLKKRITKQDFIA